MISKNMIHLQEDLFTNHQLTIGELIMETMLLPFALILELRIGAFIPKVAKNPNHKIIANLSLNILRMTKLSPLIINWFYLYCTTTVYLNSFWLANKRMENPVQCFIPLIAALFSIWIWIKFIYLFCSMLYLFALFDF